MKALLILLTTKERVDLIFKECNKAKIAHVKCAVGGNWLDCNIMQNWRVNGMNIYGILGFQFFHAIFIFRKMQLCKLFSQVLMSQLGQG